MISKQARVSPKPYQQVWHDLPERLRQQVVAHLVKLLERELVHQAEPPVRVIRPKLEVLDD
jgi:hypothetical protein